MGVTNRVEEFREYFKTHNKSKEQKAHGAKVSEKLNFSWICCFLFLKVNFLKFTAFGQFWSK